MLGRWVRVCRNCQETAAQVVAWTKKLTKKDQVRLKAAIRRSGGSLTMTEAVNAVYGGRR